MAEKRFSYGYIAKILSKGFSNITDQDKTDLVLKLYAGDEKRPLLKFRNLIRRQSVQNMTQEALLDLTETNGITAKQAIKYRKQALIGALEKGDYGNVNKALDSFDSNLDLIPTKQMTTQTQEISYIELLEGTKQALPPARAQVKQHKTVKTGDNGSKAGNSSNE